MQNLGNDPVVKVKKEDKVGASPQDLAVNLSLIETVRHKVMFISCCARSKNRSKALLPIYSLSNRFEMTCTYI